MKEEHLRQIAVSDIYFLDPVVRGNRATYAWTENPLLDEQGCWIEFPDVLSIEGSANDVFAPYLVFALAFAALGPVTIHLPGRLDDDIFGAWNQLIANSIRAVYRTHSFGRQNRFRLVNGTKPLECRHWQGRETALLFGGGTESLLTLATLRDEGISPVLAGFGGPAWGGSDPVKSGHKFELEAGVAAEFGLKRLSIRTNLFEVIYRPEWDWSEYLQPDIPGVMKAALHLPFMYTALMLIAEQVGLGRIVNGSEGENECTETWCFSTTARNDLATLGYSPAYASYLHDLTKFRITERLHLRYPDIAKYQHSCLGNASGRWCMQCPKCFKIFVLLNILGVDPARVGFDSKIVEEHMPELLRTTRKVASRPTHRDEYAGMLAEARQHESRRAEELLQQVLRGYWKRRTVTIASSQIRAAKRWLKRHLFSPAGRPGERKTGAA